MKILPFNPFVHEIISQCFCSIEQSIDALFLFEYHPFVHFKYRNCQLSVSMYMAYLIVYKTFAFSQIYRNWILNWKFNVIYNSCESIISVVKKSIIVFCTRKKKIMKFFCEKRCVKFCTFDAVWKTYFNCKWRSYFISCRKRVRKTII